MHYKILSIYYHGHILTTTVISSLNTMEIPRFTSLPEAELQLMCGDSYITSICVQELLPQFSAEVVRMFSCIRFIRTSYSSFNDAPEPA